jgi:hypothetical protein
MVERLCGNKYKLTDKLSDRVQALGFKKIYTEPDLYFYKFAVDKYKDIPTVWCKFTLDIVTGEVQIDVFKSDGSFFPAFYQELAGFDDYVEKINNRIKYKLSKFGIKKVTKKNRKKKVRVNGND